MAGKKKKKEETPEIKCDPVKETARDVLCALIGSTETEDDAQDVVKRAYDIAETFENYEI